MSIAVARFKLLVLHQSSEGSALGYRSKVIDIGKGQEMLRKGKSQKYSFEVKDELPTTKLQLKTFKHRPFTNYIIASWTFHPLK